MRTYVGGVEEQTLYPISRGDGTLLVDDYGEQYLDFGLGGLMMPTGHRDKLVYDAVVVQGHNHITKGGYGHYLDWQVAQYAKLISERTGHPGDEPLQVMFLPSAYEARLVAGHLAIMEGRGSAFIDLLTPAGAPRDGGEIQDLVHQAKANKCRVVVDESVTGYGRTGSFFYAERFGFIPDAYILGLSVGAGFPLVAVLAPRHLFTHESARVMRETMGITGLANPVICAAGRAQINQINTEMLHHVEEISAVLANDLSTVVDQFDHVIARQTGVGLVRTLHLREPRRAAMFTHYCRAAGLIIGPGLRLTPPLNATELQIRTAVDAIATACISIGADMHPEEQQG